MKILTRKKQIDILAKLNAIYPVVKPALRDTGDTHALGMLIKVLMDVGYDVAGFRGLQIVKEGLDNPVNLPERTHVLTNELSPELQEGIKNLSKQVVQMGCSISEASEALKKYYMCGLTEKAESK